MRTVGAGGRDKKNCAPMCLEHHEERHRIGIESFEEKHDVDLKEEAVKAYERVSDQ